MPEDPPQPNGSTEPVTEPPIEPPIDPHHSPLEVSEGMAVAQVVAATRRLRIPEPLTRSQNWWQLLKFSMVGGSGFIVNLVVYAISLRLMGDVPGGIEDYQLAAFIAFFIANMSNYALNRVWTFHERGGGAVLLEYLRFLAIGVLSLLVGLVILTVLVQVFELPQQLAHTGVTDLGKLIGQAIAIVVVTPIGFVGNKLWTFRGYR